MEKEKLNDDENAATAAMPPTETTSLTPILPSSRTDPKDLRDRTERFENFRDETLSKIPEEIKERFRQPAYARGGKHWFPCLELGPFDVAPGAVRDRWFAMFKNFTAQKRKPARLVYWYGSENVEGEEEDAYSFLPANKVVSYEEGVKRGHDKVPKAIRNKQAKGKKLTATETLMLKALEQIKRDADLEPSKRAEWLPKWEEVDMLSPTEEEVVDEEAEEDIEVESPVQPGKRSKKRKKRRDEGEEKTKSKTPKEKDHVEDNKVPVK